MRSRSVRTSVRPSRLAEHLDGARRRVLVERRDAQQRGLARAVRAEHDPALVGAHGPVDAVEDRRVVDARGSRPRSCNTGAVVHSARLEVTGGCLPGAASCQGRSMALDDTVDATRATARSLSVLRRRARARRAHGRRVPRGVLQHRLPDPGRRLPRHAERGRVDLLRDVGLPAVPAVRGVAPRAARRRSIRAATRSAGSRACIPRTGWCSRSSRSSCRGSTSTGCTGSCCTRR